MVRDGVVSVERAVAVLGCLFLLCSEEAVKADNEKSESEYHVQNVVDPGPKEVLLWWKISEACNCLVDIDESEVEIEDTRQARVA